MNKVYLIGNLTRDPELSETNSGVAVCRFGIAVSRRFAQGGDAERQTDFFNCTAWRGLAENVARFCKKGNKVAVVGSIQIRNFEDNSGQKRRAATRTATIIPPLLPQPRKNPPSKRLTTIQTFRSDRRVQIKTIPIYGVLSQGLPYQNF